MKYKVYYIFDENKSNNYLNFYNNKAYDVLDKENALSYNIFSILKLISISKRDDLEFGDENYTNKIEVVE